MDHPEIHNALLARLQKNSPEITTLDAVCIDLPAGPLALEVMRQEGVAYFPMGALISLGASPLTHVPAVLGLQSCLLPMPQEAGVLQAHVMVPGQACRVAWTPVQENPQRYADGLWATTLATQALLRQIAQWAFCVQHHTPVQVAASWFLNCCAQASQADWPLNWTALPQPIQQVLPQLTGIEVSHGVLQAFDLPRLRALACDCHRHIAAPIA